MNYEPSAQPSPSLARRRLSSAAALAAGVVMAAAGPYAGARGVATSVRVAIGPGSVTITLRVGGGRDGAFVFELTRFWAERRPAGGADPGPAPPGGE